MVEFEADDALAAAAVGAARSAGRAGDHLHARQRSWRSACQGTRIVQLNRRTRTTRDEAGVIEKFGVPPESIPDYLALVGDAADGYPGLPGWGAKSTAAVLAKFGHLEAIPARLAVEWRVDVANASSTRLNTIPRT